MQLFDQLHPQWQVELARHKDLIDTIDNHIANTAVAPDYKLIFRALSRPIDSTRVVIFGQDPYPTKGVAHGLAFSVDSSIEKLPPSLMSPPKAACPYASPAAISTEPPRPPCGFAPSPA